MQLQIIERDFKSECWFRAFAVVTNLVTSLEYIPICCATMLYHFGQLRNGCVATEFIHFSSPALSSATSECVTVQERTAQIEEPAFRNEERSKNRPSCAPKKAVPGIQQDRVPHFGCSV